jgi:hypothetical protein
MLPVSVMVVVVLAAGGSGSGPPPLSPGTMGADFHSWAAGEAKGTLEAPIGGTLAKLHREIGTAGTDDGEGPDSLTLAITVNGAPACSESILCTATGAATTTCTGTFAAGQDIHIEVTAEACGTLPKFVASAQWWW